MDTHLKESKNELKKTLKEKREKVGELLSGMIKSKTEKEAPRPTLQAALKEAPRPALQTAHRHNFIENAVVQNLLKKSAASY